MDVAEIPLPPALERLLAELEAPSPSIQEFKVDLSSHQFGGFFKESSAQEDGARARVHQRVRLRVLRAIGNCTSLRTIHVRRASVTEAEAEAFLQALQQSNHVLEVLDVSGCKGFGSAAACVALAGLLRTTRTLTKLNLWSVGLTSEGLRHIAAALRAPHACSLQKLNVNWNTSVGLSGGGAPHLADIITRTSTLRELRMYNIGMDRAGGEMIAHALATNPSIEELHVGWSDRDGRHDANQSAALTSILRALTPLGTRAGGFRDHSSASSQTPRHTPNVKNLKLFVYGLITAELGEAFARMVHSNTCIQTLLISTSFIGLVLEALTYSTSITALQVSHAHWLDEDEVDFRMLTSVVFGCKQLRSLEFRNDVPSKAKRQIFQALKDNPNIKRLVIDGWTGLDDDMFNDFIISLLWNGMLENISMKGTTWEKQGKLRVVDELLKRNKFGSGNDTTRDNPYSVRQQYCYPDKNFKSGKRRGVAVLISMEKGRQGGAVDRGRLETLAHSLKLNYDGNNFLDYDADELKKELLDLAHDRNRILPDDDCFVCFVNAHGGTDKGEAFFFTDCNGSPISLLEDVVEPFCKCENLVNKPKIFFVNACRGGDVLQGKDDPVGGPRANEEHPIPSSWSLGAERRDSKDLVTILTLLTSNLVHMLHEETDAASGEVTKVLRQGGAGAGRHPGLCGSHQLLFHLRVQSGMGCNISSSSIWGARGRRAHRLNRCLELTEGQPLLLLYN